METFLSLLIGIGLSAACGFRVFVPLLVVSIASHTGHLHLSSGFEWMGSDAALIAFAVATVLEVAAYYIPWLDNLLDTIASPAAVIAGTLVTASLVADMSPFLKWTLAVIAGGGIAGLVQGTTVVTRGASTASTCGLANPILATAELGGSFSFIEVGNAMQLESLLKGDTLPAYEDLAGYVFYTATGEEFDARAIKRKTHFIGESARYDVYLLYEPDMNYLKNTALTLDMARSLPKGGGKRRLVFAPTKYLDSIHLEENRIDFCQLPFEIYKAVKPKKA